MLLRWIEILVMFTGIVLTVTQVVIPLWQGRAILPIFKGKLRAAERSLGTALDYRDINAMVARARDVRGEKKDRRKNDKHNVSQAGPTTNPTGE